MPGQAKIVISLERGIQMKKMYFSYKFVCNQNLRSGFGEHIGSVWGHLGGNSTDVISFQRHVWTPSAQIAHQFAELSDLGVFLGPPAANFGTVLARSAAVCCPNGSNLGAETGQNSDRGSS